MEVKLAPGDPKTSQRPVPRYPDKGEHFSAKAESEGRQGRQGVQSRQSRQSRQKPGMLSLFVLLSRRITTMLVVSILSDSFPDCLPRGGRILPGES